MNAHLMEELPQLMDGRTERGLRAADVGCGCFFDVDYQLTRTAAELR